LSGLGRSRPGVEEKGLGDIESKINTKEKEDALDKKKGGFDSV